MGKDLFLENMLVMEHGIMPPDDSDTWQPVKQGMVCFFAFACFGLVPLACFLVFHAAGGSTDDEDVMVWIAYAITATTIFVMGLTKAKLTGSEKWLKSGAIMVVNGTVAGGVAYVIGDLLTMLF